MISIGEAAKSTGLSCSAQPHYRVYVEEFEEFVPELDEVPYSESRQICGASRKSTHSLETGSVTKSAAKTQSCASVEEAYNLSSNMLSSRLLMIHDTRGSCENDKAELTRG